MPESRFTLTIEAENLAKEAFRSFQADVREANEALTKTDQAVSSLTGDGKELGDTLRQLHEGGRGELSIARGVHLLTSAFQSLQRETKAAVAAIDEINKKSLDSPLATPLARRGDYQVGGGRLPGGFENLRTYFDKAIGDNYQPLPQSLFPRRSFDQEFALGGEVPPSLSLGRIGGTGQVFPSALPTRRIGPSESFSDFASGFPDFVEG